MFSLGALVLFLVDMMLFSPGRTITASGMGLEACQVIQRRGCSSAARGRSLRQFGRPISCHGRLRRMIVVAEKATDAVAPPTLTAVVLASNTVS